MGIKIYVPEKPTLDAAASGQGSVSGRDLVKALKYMAEALDKSTSISYDKHEADINLILAGGSVEAVEG